MINTLYGLINVKYKKNIRKKEALKEVLSLPKILTAV